MDMGYNRKNRSPEAKGSMAPLENFTGLKMAGVWTLKEGERGEVKWS